MPRLRLRVRSSFHYNAPLRAMSRVVTAMVLGMAYEAGHGVQRSCAHAAKWVTRAAHQGNAAAEYNLALRYRTGDGVKADPDEAEKWLRKAARRRYPGARPVLAAENLHGPRAAGQP